MAKFREKCAISSAALLKLTKDIEWQTRATPKCVVIQQISKANASKPKVDEPNVMNSGEIYFGFDDDNVEYVVLESTEHSDDANIVEHNVEEQQVNQHVTSTVFIRKC